MPRSEQLVRLLTSGAAVARPYPGPYFAASSERYRSASGPALARSQLDGSCWLKSLDLRSASGSQGFVYYSAARVEWIGNALRRSCWGPYWHSSWTPFIMTPAMRAALFAVL